MGELLANNILEILTETTGEKTKWKSVKAVQKQEDFDGRLKWY